MQAPIERHDVVGLTFARSDGPTANCVAFNIRIWLPADEASG
jgi:hypothetical protein